MSEADIGNPSSKTNSNVVGSNNDHVGDIEAGGVAGVGTSESGMNGDYSRNTSSSSSSSSEGIVGTSYECNLEKG